MKRGLALALLAVACLFFMGQTRDRGSVDDLRWGSGSWERVLASTGDTLTRYGFTPYNVLAYGVDNTGTTDCSDSLQAVIDLAEADGGSVYIPDGTYKLSSGLTVYNSDPDKRVRIIMEPGAVLLADTTINGQIVNISGSSQNYNIIWDGGVIRCADTDSVDWDNTVGMNVFNTVRSRFRDMEIVGFKKGLRVYGSTNLGCSYNRFEPRRISDCETAIEVTHANTGWANENTFIGGQLQWTSTLAGIDASAGWGIYCAHDTGSTNVINGNRFYDQSIEIGSGLAAIPGRVFFSGYNHTFFGIRFDGAGMDKPYFDSRGEGVGGDPSATEDRRTLIMQGYGAYHFPSQIFEDDADSLRRQEIRANVMAGQGISWNGGSATEGVLNLRTQATGYRALTIHQSADSLHTAIIWGSGKIAPQWLEYPLISAPGDTSVGTLFFDSADSTLKVWTGAAFEALH